MVETKKNRTIFRSELKRLLLMSRRMLLLRVVRFPERVFAYPSFRLETSAFAAGALFARFLNYLLIEF